jgi:hypothetical protein
MASQAEAKLMTLAYNADHDPIGRIITPLWLCQEKGGTEKSN